MHETETNLARLIDLPVISDQCGPATDRCAGRWT